MSDDDYESALSGWMPGRPAAKPAAPAADDADLFGGPKKGPEHFAALDRIRDWTRERFKLPEDAVISAAELICQLPGCPPLETTVSFWDADGTRYHFKLMKPPEEVVEENLPYAWMKESLIQPEGFGCECC
jgi:nitrate reductase delta subunit